MVCVVKSAFLQFSVRRGELSTLLRFSWMIPREYLEKLQFQVLEIALSKKYNVA